MKKLISVFLWLLMTAASLGAVTNTQTLLLIDGRPVTVAEYETYCRLCPVLAGDSASRMDDFINFKLKAVEASAAGCDTLPSFLAMLHALSAEVERRSLRSAAYGLIVQRGGWVKVEMLTLPVRQDASPRVLEKARQELQAVCRLLQENRSLSLSQMASGRTYTSGERWLPVDWFLPEEEEAIRRTDIGAYSDVFVSSVGVSLLRVLDRTDDYSRTLEPALAASFPLKDRVLKDILLAMWWNHEQADRVNQDVVGEKELDSYFHQNRAHYAFHLPHYKGVVVYCADKGTARYIRRKMKKVSLRDWPAGIELLVRQHKTGRAKSEYGLFQIGANDAVDALAFKCVELPEDRDYPYVFVKGKILKHGPECLDDVRKKVIHDYKAFEKERQLYCLQNRHAVEVLSGHP